jgi:hypothetical protein
MHSRELPLVGNAKKRSKKKKKTRWVGAFRWFLHMYVGVDFFFFRRPSSAVSFSFSCAVVLVGVRAACLPTTNLDLGSVTAVCGAGPWTGGCGTYISYPARPLPLHKPQTHIWLWVWSQAWSDHAFPAYVTTDMFAARSAWVNFARFLPETGVFLDEAGEVSEGESAAAAAVNPVLPRRET